GNLRAGRLRVDRIEVIVDRLDIDATDRLDDVHVEHAHGRDLLLRAAAVRALEGEFAQPGVVRRGAFRYVAHEHARVIRAEADHVRCNRLRERLGLDAERDFAIAAGAGADLVQERPGLGLPAGTV